MNKYIEESDIDYRGEVFYIGKGWHPLVIPLVDFVLDNGGVVDQVKEKFGGLRFYYSPPVDEYGDEKWQEFDKLVSKAEHDSYSICEYSGNPGKLRSNGGWMKTLSDEVAEEMGYSKGYVKFPI